MSKKFLTGEDVVWFLTLILERYHPEMHVRCRLEPNVAKELSSGAAGDQKAMGSIPRTSSVTTEVPVLTHCLGIVAHFRL